MNYEWRFLTLQEAGIKIIPPKKEMLKGKVVV